MQATQYLRTVWPVRRVVQRYVMRWSQMHLISAVGHSHTVASTVCLNKKHPRHF